MKKQIILLLIAPLMILFSACDKPEGKGGTSTITGKVTTEDYNATFTVLEATYPTQDEDVYIIYGSNTSYGDKVKTNYNGEYEFKYLREGSYKIYTYSKDKTLQSPSGQIAIIKEVKITDTDQKVTVDDITIYK